MAEYEVGTVNDIAKIVMTGGAGVPNERLCTLTNLVISDSDVAELKLSVTVNLLRFRVLQQQRHLRVQSSHFQKVKHILGQ